MAKFSSKTVEDKSQWNDTFEVLKEITVSQIFYIQQKYPSQMEVK
jgi:hypothetical protein